MPKKELDWKKLDMLNAAARRVEALPPGPGKEKKKAEYREAIAQIYDEYQVPAEVIAPDIHMLGFVDWLDGLLRTGAWEPLRAARAGYDKIRGNPTSYSGASALDNLVSAALPGGQPARDTRYYLDETKLPIPDVRVSDIPGMAKNLQEPGKADAFQITPGGPLDISLKGVLGFAGDAGISAKNFERMLKGPEKIVPAAEKALKVGDLELENPTAAMIRHQQEKAALDAARAGAPGIMESLKKLPAAAWGFLVDPTKPIAEALHDWRLRHANEALRLEGHGDRAFSKMMREHPELKGVTSEGIRSDLRSVIAKNEDAIDELTQGPWTTDSHGRQVRRGGIVDRGMVPNMPRGSSGDFEYLNFPEGQTYLDPVTGQKVHIPASDIHPGERSLLGPLWDEEQRAIEKQIAGGANAQGARRRIESEIRQAEAANPGFNRLEGDFVERQAKEGQRASEQFRGEQVPLWEGRPKTVTRTGPQVQIGGVERPFKTVETVEGVPAQHGKALQFDPLEYERGVPWTEVRDTRRGWQGELAERNWYNRRKDNLNPPTPGEAKKIEAEAGLYSRLVDNASKMETDSLDEVRQGLGGHVKRRHQETSKALQGGQYLDRAPKAGPTQKTMTAFNPWGGRAFSMAQDAAHGGAMAGYQMLRDPVTRYLVAPGARALWLENAWDRLNTPTEENPYALFYKYGVRP